MKFTEEYPRYVAYVENDHGKTYAGQANRRPDAWQQAEDAHRGLVVADATARPAIWDRTLNQGKGQMSYFAKAITVPPALSVPEKDQAERNMQYAKELYSFDQNELDLKAGKDTATVTAALAEKVFGVTRDGFAEFLYNLDLKPTHLHKFGTIRTIVNQHYGLINEHFSEVVRAIGLER